MNPKFKVGDVLYCFDWSKEYEPYTISEIAHDYYKITNNIAGVFSIPIKSIDLYFESNIIYKKKEDFKKELQKIYDKLD